MVSMTTPLRAVAIAATAVAVLLVALTAFRIDISALRDWEQDTVARTALPPRPDVDRYADPSPYTIWLPSTLFVWDSVRAGTLPSWNRLQGGGYSPITGLQEGVLHPFRWLVAVFPRTVAPSALIVLTLGAAWTGMFLLARFELGYSRWAAALSAVVFAFCPLTISQAQFSGMLLPLAHIPWAVFFLLRSARAFRANFVGLCLTLGLLIAAGHALIIGCALFTIAASAAISGAWRPVITLAAATALAMLLAAPAYMPLIVSSADLWSYKTATAAGHSYIIFSMRGWVSAVRAILIDGYKYGDCCLDLAAYYLYIGIPALLLIAAGIARSRADKRHLGAAVLFALGFLIVVPGPWMAPVIPLFSLFKPWYLAGTLAFFSAWLAGAGFDKLTMRAIAVLLAVIVVTTYVWRSREVFQPRRLVVEPVSPVIEFLRREPEPFRITTVWGQNHTPNSARISGIEDIRLSGPTLPLRYHSWWQAVDRLVIRRSYPTSRLSDQLLSPMIGDFNIKYVLQGRYDPVTNFRTRYDSATHDRKRSRYLEQFPVVFRTQWLEVRRLAEPFRPRAHFADRIVRVPRFSDAVEVLTRYNGLPAQAAVVESGEPLGVPRGATGTVTVRYPNDTRASLSVESGTGGLVILHDSFADGWSATVDGEPARIYPVNILSRGVIVPPGRHTIDMSYIPPGLVGGAALTAVGALVIALVTMRTKR
jgi:hypothetical protein